MKLTNIRFVERYVNPETNTEVNVYKAMEVEHGVTVRFWLQGSKRNIISDADFFNNWKEAE